MANFVAVFDTNTARRKSFIEKCTTKIDFLGTLKKGNISVENFDIVWAANKNAPISTDKDDKGFSIIFGDAIKAGEARRMNAKELRSKWSNTDKAIRNSYDGYYAAIKFERFKGLIIGTDILGLFPVYYLSASDFILAGSSPELFKYHPGFKKRIDKLGLTGICLTTHITEGRTLWKNVKRLKPGFLLEGKPNTHPKEHQQYKIPFSNKYYKLPFSHLLNLVHKEFQNTVERHVPKNETHTILYTGGKDSRLLGGYIKNMGADLNALTIGKSSDFEMKIARKATAASNIPHEQFKVADEDYHKLATIQAKWEHGLNGFNNPIFWSLYERLKNKSKRVITGLINDATFDASYCKWSFDTSNYTSGFGNFFKEMNRWGVPINILNKMLAKPTFRDEADKIKEKLHSSYNRFSTDEFERSWSFGIHHRARFHLGSRLWQLSFGAWPVIPTLDRNFISTINALPPAALFNKRLIAGLLRTRFPVLAAIEFDNNSLNPQPLIHTWRSMIKGGIRSKVYTNKYFNKIRKWFDMEKEDSLYYYRIYNVNGNGWLDIRNKAENGRSLLNTLFNKHQFNLYLPGPDTKIKTNDGIIDSSGRKTLLGLMIWAKQNFRDVEELQNALPGDT